MTSQLLPAQSLTYPEKRMGNWQLKDISEVLSFVMDRRGGSRNVTSMRSVLEKWENQADKQNHPPKSEKPESWQRF